VRGPLPGRAVLALGLAACSTAPMPEKTRPLVVVSIFPVADLVASVGGEDVEVRTLLPPRASPATWEATPSQVRMLSGADAFVAVGGGLDDWLGGLEPDEARMPHLRIVDGLELLDTEGDARRHGRGNPHVWLDPVLMRDNVIPRVQDLLIQLVPEAAEGIRGRAASWADSLTALDREIRNLLDDATSRSFVATHEAWGYFAKRYGLTSLGSLYERPGHEPSAQGLALVLEGARDARLTAILTEPQLAESAAKALAAELGGEVLLVDPLGGPGLPGRERYCDLMRFNARSFRAALEAR
jgi:zinc transport system substrate-binding protein